MLRSFELRDSSGCFLEERTLRIDFVELLKAKRLLSKDLSSGFSSSMELGQTKNLVRLGITDELSTPTSSWPARRE
jgi:hypothetical protein